MSLKTLLRSLSKGEVLIPALRTFLEREHEDVREGDQERHEASLEDTRLSILALQRRVTEFNHRDDADYPGYLHPSSIGTCLRQVWFRHHKAPALRSLRDDSLKSELTLTLGTYMHLIIQNLCKRAGLLLRRELEVLDHKLKVVGHADGLLRIDGVRYLLELKSINARRFQSVLANPEHSHKMQLMLYMAIKKEQWGIILYWEKDSATLKEYVIPFDPVFFKETIQGRVERYHQAVADGCVPEREGDSPSTFPCSYCAFSGICFDNAKLKAFVRNLHENRKKDKLRF